MLTLWIQWKKFRFSTQPTCKHWETFLWIHYETVLLTFSESNITMQKWSKTLSSKQFRWNFLKHHSNFRWPSEGIFSTSRRYLNRNRIDKIITYGICKIYAGRCKIVCDTKIWFEVTLTVIAFFFLVWYFFDWDDTSSSSSSSHPLFKHDKNKAKCLWGRVI